MTYAFTVTVERRGMLNDKYTFTVAAEVAGRAIYKAVRQARTDSGYKRGWHCTSLERGGWLVS